MKKYLIVILLIVLSLTCLSQDKYYDGKVLEIENIELLEEDESLIGIEKVKLLLENKEIIEVENPKFKESAYTLKLKKNMNVIVLEEHSQDGFNKYYITDINKKNGLSIITFIFLLLTVVIAKLKGLKALLALGITIGLIFYLFIPLISKGFSPILLATIISIVSSFITIFLMDGVTEKGVVAVLGSVSGTIISGVISFWFCQKYGISGFSSLEDLNYSNMLTGIKVSELVPAGIILGSMGAVMDVGMSISSALNEIKYYKTDVTSKELFSSGIKIGQDIIGTMINTLVLAYIGGTLFTILVLYLQKDVYTLNRLINYEFISVEILRSITGSIGVLIAVPTTSFFAGKIKFKRED